jgi:hypothetical protein
MYSEHFTFSLKTLPIIVNFGFGQYKLIFSSWIQMKKVKTARIHANQDSKHCHC